MSDDGNDTTPTIAPVRSTPTCPHCPRDLELRIEQKANGKVHVALTCPRHGSFPRGWRPKFLDNARAQAWAERQRQRQQHHNPR